MAPKEVRDFRRSVLRRDIPSMLQWGMAIYASVSLIDLALGVNTVTDVLIDAAVILAFFGTHRIVQRVPMDDALVPWLVGGVCTVAIIGLSAELGIHPEQRGAGFASLLLVMVAAGPLSLEYLPTAMVGLGLGIAYAMHANTWDATEAHAWFAVVITTIALSFVLLRVRHLGIDALALVTAQVRESALRDPLTGTLNRRGVQELAEHLRGIAHRQSAPTFVLMVDIVGLKAANDAHGHDFGDEVIVSVARAIGASVREADLICRWGGDEFVILGLGEPWSPHEFEQRIARACVASGMDTSRWNPEVTAGASVNLEGTWDLEGLVAKADAAMYARRARARHEA